MRLVFQVNENVKLLVGGRHVIVREVQPIGRVVFYVVEDPETGQRVTLHEDNVRSLRGAR